VVNTGIPGKLLSNYSTTGALVMADFLGGPTPGCTVNHSSNPANNQQTNPFACLTASEFATTATQADCGNIARNQFRGPGYFDTDLSIKKTFRITENGLAFTLGANAYNILNHPNFGNPDNVVTSSTFGTVQNTVTPASSPLWQLPGCSGIWTHLATGAEAQILKFVSLILGGFDGGRLFALHVLQCDRLCRVCSMTSPTTSA
jgi:hypothetical protein